MARYLFIPSCEVDSVDQLEGTQTEIRLKRGLELWAETDYNFIIVAGGLYLPRHRQTRPSGVLMKEWLMRRGVPQDQIICEQQSHDTYENIYGAMRFIVRDEEKRITVVTHWQHALRFWVTFRRALNMNVRIIPIFYWAGLKTFIMEWPMLLVHVFDRDGTSKISKLNREQRRLDALKP